MTPSAKQWAAERPGALHLFITAGEASGDALGAALMRDLKAKRPAIRFSGVGGPKMLAEGLEPVFAMADIAVMGFLPVLKRLPLLLRRIRQTALAAASFQPDAVVLIDAQDFSKRVARRLRRLAPAIPIIGYVAPSVWAWRPGRAKALRPLLDLLLCVLPFEPAVFERLSGPPARYVGHPLVQQMTGRFRAATQPGSAKKVLLLPGSRRSEIERLLPVFGQAAQSITLASHDKVDFVLPTLPHLHSLVEQAVAHWPVKAKIVIGDEEKWQAFMSADAALAASGTVTLELALADVPMVVGYKVSAVEAAVIRRLAIIETSVLPDIILGKRETPLLLQNDCSSEALAAALLPLLAQTAQRRRQLALFETLRQIMTSSNVLAPADAILDLLARGGRQNAAAST